MHGIAVSMCAGRSYVYRCPRCGCTTTARTAMPCRRVRPWRERPHPSGAWYGTATAGMCTAIPASRGVAPGPSIPCGKANGQPGRARPGLCSATPDSPAANRSADTSSAASMRRSTPSWKECWPGATSRGGTAWACPCRSSPMARHASKEGGRSGHSRILPRATNAPAVIAQPQCGQRHMTPARCPGEGRVCVRTPPMSGGHSPYGPGDAGSGIENALRIWVSRSGRWP